MFSTERLNSVKTIENTVKIEEKMQNPRIKDLKGKKFHYLTVLELVGRINRKTMWSCRCKCGKEVVVWSSNLISKTSKSCGCYKSEQTSKNSSLKLKGRRFGKLKVIKRVGTNRPKNGKNICSLWLCQCDCSRTCIVRGVHLVHNHTTSCGCYNPTQLPAGQAALNKLYGRIKRNAKEGGHAFRLSKKKVKELTSQSCVYCGSPPQKSMSNSDPSGRFHGDLVYSGLDRVNNKKGYTVQNVAPACWNCNMMKRAHSVDEFKSHISKIYNHFVKEAV